MRQGERVPGPSARPVRWACPALTREAEAAIAEHAAVTGPFGDAVRFVWLFSGLTQFAGVGPGCHRAAQ
ncbi:MAG: hypothetical protein ACTHQQ_14315 [Solirubrobacteraceae bacterium]